jgi:hypothetical protein
MSWRIEVEPGGLAWVDPGPDRPGLKEAIRDCVESLSPIGEAPGLSTYLIDRALSALSPTAPTEGVIANGNAWSLVRRGDTVTLRFDYAKKGEAETQTIRVGELVAGLSAYRDAVLRALRAGHKLDDRRWSQKNA